jgi:transposase
LSPEIPPPSKLEKELLKRNEQLEEKVARLGKENRILRELRRLDLIKKYGAGSESLSLQQLELLELEPGVNGAEVQGEAQREPTAAKNERKHPGRHELPAHLERVEQIIACTPEQCVCGICGKEKQLIGYEASEVLDVQPAKYFVRLTKREKRACKGCEEGGVSCAPLPERIIDKGLGSDRVVIDAVINKYSFHLPLYRQSVILERESGLHLSRATLDGWLMRVGGDVNSDREGHGSGTFSGQLYPSR